MFLDTEPHPAEDFYTSWFSEKSPIPAESECGPLLERAPAALHLASEAQRFPLLAVSGSFQLALLQCSPELELGHGSQIVFSQ